MDDACARTSPLFAGLGTTRARHQVRGLQRLPLGRAASSGQVHLRWPIRWLHRAAAITILILLLGIAPAAAQTCVLSVQGCGYTTPIPPASTLQPASGPFILIWLACTPTHRVTFAIPIPDGMPEVLSVTEP